MESLPIIYAVAELTVLLGNNKEIATKDMALNLVVSLEYDR